MESNTVSKRDLKYFLRRYVQEFIEAFIGLFIINVFTKKPIEYKSLFKTSLLLGLITLILEEYNPAFNSNVKQGMSFSVGASLIGG